MDFGVQIEPVNTTGPGMRHRADGDQVHIPDEIRGEITGLPWRVRFALRLSNDDELTPDVADLRVEQVPDGPPVTSGALRSIPIAEARRIALRMAATRWVEVDGRWVMDWSQVSADRLGDATRRPYRRVTDDDLRRTADLYREAKRRPGMRDHLIYLAERLVVSRATAARYLARARAAGMIADNG